MIDLPEHERRRSFAIWLRTGRLPPVRNADGVELKFNPWHDPQNGRFTFAGTGRRSGGSGDNGGGGNRLGGSTGTGDGSMWGARSTSLTARPAVKATPPNSKHERATRGSWTEGGLTGGGGSTGGGGATGSWEQPGFKRPPATAQIAPSIIARPTPARGNALPSAQSAGASSEPVRTEVRNGYTYEIDARGRTRRVSGTLTVAAVPVRSRAAQAGAGCDERRRSDDGGHYIAARFNGPTEAFNHFAQDANFNRGTYRALEDQWAKAKRAGKSVTVKIVPHFDGLSKRPSMINVWFTIDGSLKSLQFPNERSEKPHGK